MRERVRRRERDLNPNPWRQRGREGGMGAKEGREREGETIAYQRTMTSNNKGKTSTKPLKRGEESKQASKDGGYETLKA